MEDAIYISTDSKTCPTCGQELAAAAEACPACNARFEVYTCAYCVHCHQLIHTTADGKCPDCGGADLLDPRLFSQMITAGTPPGQPAPKGKPCAETIHAETKKCPICAETIKAEARLCRFCGARFEVAVKGYCMNCHAQVVPDANDKCPHCGNELVDRHIASTLLGEPPPSPVPVIAPPAPVPRPSVLVTPVPDTTASVTAISTSPVTRVRMPFWQLYCSPKGRIGRLTFFLRGMLPVWGLFILTGGLTGVAINTFDTSNPSSAAAILLYVGVSVLLLGVLFLYWVFLMLIVKRFHDLGQSGWNILLWLVPLVGQVLSLVSWIQFFFVKGNPGPNRFGDTAD